MTNNAIVVKAENIRSGFSKVIINANPGKVLADDAIAAILGTKLALSTFGGVRATTVATDSGVVEKAALDLEISNHEDMASFLARAGAAIPADMADRILEANPAFKDFEPFTIKFGFGQRNGKTTHSYKDTKAKGVSADALSMLVDLCNAYDIVLLAYIGA